MGDNQSKVSIKRSDQYTIDICNNGRAEGTLYVQHGRVSIAGNGGLGGTSVDVEQAKHLIEALQLFIAEESKNNG